MKIQINMFTVWTALRVMNTMLKKWAYFLVCNGFIQVFNLVNVIIKWDNSCEVENVQYIIISLNII